MKFIERLRARSELKRERELRARSEDPNGPGWVIDPNNPSIVYVAGRRCELDEKGYTLAELERQYVLLKQSLALYYPKFKSARIDIIVEPWLAGPIMKDAETLANFSPIVSTWTPVDCQETQYDRIDGLRTYVVFGGDKQVLELRGCYFDGYGFFVHGHPGKHDGNGKWCRVTPDALSVFTGASTF